MGERTGGGADAPARGDPGAARLATGRSHGPLLADSRMPAIQTRRAALTERMRPRRTRQRRRQHPLVVLGDIVRTQRRRGRGGTASRTSPARHPRESSRFPPPRAAPRIVGSSDHDIRREYPAGWREEHRSGTGLPLHHGSRDATAWRGIGLRVAAVKSPVRSHSTRRNSGRYWRVGTRCRPACERPVSAWPRPRACSPWQATGTAARRSACS